MAHLPNTRLPGLRPSADGKWLRCPLCSAAYWGAFRDTDHIASRLNKHLAKSHAGEVEPVGGPAADAAPARKLKASANGPVQIVREAGAPVTDDPLAQIGNELDPRLALGQGPRMFAEEGGDKRRAAGRANRARQAAA